MFAVSLIKRGFSPRIKLFLNNVYKIKNVFYKFKFYDSHENNDCCNKMVF